MLSAKPGVGGEGAGEGGEGGARKGAGRSIEGGTRARAGWDGRGRGGARGGVMAVIGGGAGGQGRGKGGEKAKDCGGRLAAASPAAPPCGRRAPLRRTWGTKPAARVGAGRRRGPRLGGRVRSAGLGEPAGLSDVPDETNGDCRVGLWQISRREPSGKGRGAVTAHPLGRTIPTQVPVQSPSGWPLSDSGWVGAGGREREGFRSAVRQARAWAEQRVVARTPHPLGPGCSLRG